MEGEFGQKEQELKELELKSSAVKQDIAEHYALLMQEFWRYYPPLSYISKVHLSVDSMKGWLEQRRARMEGQE